MEEYPFFISKHRGKKGEWVKTKEWKNRGKKAKEESTEYGTGKVDSGKLDQSCKKSEWSCTSYLETPYDLDV